jgi:3-oxoacyl-[acyl-carrier-protein] synthase-3
VAAEAECASDLGITAAQRLFDEGVCTPGEIDFLLFCTQSPDYFLPTTACTMQARLGLSTACGALDFNLGCSGYVYGLALAKGLIETRQATSLLLVTAETYSKFIHPRDRSVRTIFSDGAAATLITAIEGDEDLVGPFVFGTDGSGARELIVPAGGMRLPTDRADECTRVLDSGETVNGRFLYMDGAEIFNFTLGAVPAVVGRLLHKSGRQAEQVDMYVFHQANRFMLERLQKKLRIPAERFCINMEGYGNTVSSTVPMALELLLREGRIGPGSAVMLVGFGVGLSWAACMATLV